MFKHWNNQNPRPVEQAAIAALQHHGATLWTVSALLKLFKTNEYAGRQRIARLTEHGILIRIRSGLYQFNDPARRDEVEVQPAEVLRACAPDAVLAYETAMAAHGLGGLTDPTQLKVFSAALTKPRALADGWTVAPFPADLERDIDELNVPGFGVARVTTAEETILDALDQPRRMGGGVLQVARFIGHMRGDLDVSWLVNRAVTSRGYPMLHRLGLLLEMSGQAEPEHLAKLRALLVPQYRVLDPSAARSAERLKYWMLEVNVPYEELAKALGVPWPPEE